MIICLSRNPEDLSGSSGGVTSRGIVRLLRARWIWIPRQAEPYDLIFRDQRLLAGSATPAAEAKSGSIAGRDCASSLGSSANPPKLGASAAPEINQVKKALDAKPTSRGGQ